MKLFQRLPPWVVPVAVLATGALIVYSWLARPTPQPKKETEEYKLILKQLEEYKRKTSSQDRVIADLQRKERERTSEQKNLRTRTTERIERYAQPQAQPAPAPPRSGSAPVQVAMAPPTVVPVSIPVPYEVVHRETVIDDQGRIDREREAEEQRHREEERQNQEAEESRRMVDQKVDQKKTVQTGGGGEERPARLGVGVLSGQSGGPAPFASFDVISKPAGPKIFGKKRLQVGLGGFVTKGVDSGVDFGPEVNVGTKNIFLMGGYRVKSKDPVVGVGVRFKF